MKEHRHARARERKAHLSPDAERMVAAALGLANSGSRIEDRFWEAQLAARIERLLDSGHIQAVYDSLDRLHQTDSEAYGALIEAVEEAAETVSAEIDGQRWEMLLVAAPLVVWTRFRIPSGPLPRRPWRRTGRRTCCRTRRASGCRPAFTASTSCLAISASCAGSPASWASRR